MLAFLFLFVCVYNKFSLSFSLSKFDVGTITPHWKTVGLGDTKPRAWVARPLPNLIWSVDCRPNMDHGVAKLWMKRSFHYRISPYGLRCYNIFLRWGQSSLRVEFKAFFAPEKIRSKRQEKHLLLWTKVSHFWCMTGLLQRILHFAEVDVEQYSARSILVISYTVIARYTDHFSIPPTSFADKYH